MYHLRQVVSENFFIILYWTLNLYLDAQEKRLKIFNYSSQTKITFNMKVNSPIFIDKMEIV